MNINKAILIGRVGKDPERTNFDNGDSISKFSLATTDKYKNKAGEKVENTEWHNIVISGKLTDIVDKYVKKGDLLYIEGKIKTKSFEKDGIKKYVTEIHVGYNGTIQMLGSKQSNSGNEVRLPESDIDGDDDLPF
jgi:single-strand DNA-binding protein